MFTPAKIIEGAIRRAFLSRRGAAALLGVTEPYLDDVLAGRRRVSPEMAELVCQAIERDEPDLLRADFALYGALADGWDVRRINPEVLAALRAPRSGKVDDSAGLIG